jgi:TonB family protein
MSQWFRHKIQNCKRMKTCPQCSTGYPDSQTACPIHVHLLNRMRKRKMTAWFVALILVAASLLALAQSDAGPILLPKPKPVARPTAPSATLLVICDLACNWKLDGKAKGRIVAGESATTSVSLGQHVVIATTEDSVDRVLQIVACKANEQTVVSIELKPVRDARLKSEQEARDKASQEVRDKADQEARDKTAQEEKPRLDQFSRPKVKSAAPTRVSISAGVAGGLLLEKTAPVYPLIAREARVSGTVVIQATITKTGEVENLHVVSGPTMLRQSALDAVKTWRYKPYMVEGEPVDVETTISVNFSLGG